MHVDDVERELVKLHQEVQVDGGFDDSEGITGETRPLEDLKGFDSLLIPQMIRQLAKKLGNPFPKNTRMKNIYRVDRTDQTIHQIAEKFCETYVQEVAKV